MTRLGPYNVHPFADAFPLMEGEEFEDFVRDVKKNGLRQPIVITNDRAVLVDGRNRYRACEAAGVDAVFETLGQRYDDSMILDLIVSANLERRHLNPGQKAMLALRYEEAYAAVTPIGRPPRETSADLRSFPKSAARAAAAVGASTRAVEQAKAVQRDAPDLADQVRAGAIALDAADRERRNRAKAQPRPDPPPKPAAVMLTLRTHAGDEVQYPKPGARATFNETSGPGISWAAWSWNPVTGCLHGCNYCYAREIATSTRFADAYPVGFTPLFHEERLDAPANTTIPERYSDRSHVACGDGTCKICAYRRVFVCSMADLYGRWVPDEWIERVHASMLATPWWEYLLLTKFPSRYVGLDLPPSSWVGTSVDEQKRVRIAEEAFRKIEGVKVKWLSLEPLREPLEFTDLSVFDWVVIGAQTSTRQPDGVVAEFAPPAEWVVRITQQAIDAGCKVHWKPNLRTNPGMRWLDQYPEG